jgi:glycosyltransferase involved in cell wall biosynthesis
MKAAPRTVLMVCYAFPPEAYVGGRRALKYCKYLGQLGWRPIVVTIKPRRDAFQDEKLSEQLPSDVVVLRTRDLDGVRVMETISGWIHRLRPRHATPAVSHADVAPAPADGGRADASSKPGTSTRQGWLSRAKAFAQRLLLESPDSHVFWVPVAFMRGACVLLTRRVAVIYSSSPPHSSHLAAFLLATCFRKPHVVDFRDPWITTGPVEAFAKRLVVRNAARVVVVSPGEPDELRTEFPWLEGRRVTVVTNGYDAEDFAMDESVAPDPSHFTITHAGTIYRETGQDFFEAVDAVVTRTPELRQVLRVNLIGDISHEHDNLIRRLESIGIVRTCGVQPHQATLAHLRQSDVLLILQRGGTSPASHIPAKLFEYLFTAKPILAIAGPGSMSEVLAASGLGVTVPPSDVPRLASAIEHLYRELRSDAVRLRPDLAYISRFDRRNLTARFADVLEEATSAN